MSVLTEDLRIALAYLTLSVRRGNGRQFLILLSRYTIEGTPYSASMLTVSPGHVRDISVTPTGILCLATFPGEALARQDRRAGTKLSGGGYVVRLTVDRADVYGIHAETAPRSGSFSQLYARTS